MTENHSNQNPHILSIESLGEESFLNLLQNADSLSGISKREIKKTPALRGKTIINLFCENSTRTRTSFEIAAKWLSADAINVSATSSSLKKGESLLDMARTLNAMSPDVIIIRHKSAGVPKFLTEQVDAAVINAGDGMHSHPTQALLDCLSLMQHYDAGIEGLKGKRVAIVGDIVHSRVARSNIWAHALLGNEVMLIAPETLLPDNFADRFPGKISIHRNLEEGLEGADIVSCLRLQLERQANHFIPSLEEYTNKFFVSKKLLDRVANAGYVVMHPGPINRGVEVETSLIDSESSLVCKQVENGVAVRMACLIHSCLAPEANPTVGVDNNE